MISEPVQIMLCPTAPPFAGTGIAAQVPVSVGGCQSGVYRPPEETVALGLEGSVSKSLAPPQISISEPVQTPT